MENQSPQSPALIVGIGASAGGLEPLERFFEGVPIDNDIAFIVVQHLSPDFKSLMDELLARHTRMPIRKIEDGMTIAPSHVYLMPPRTSVRLEGLRLRLSDEDTSRWPNLPIDTFFRSLAKEAGTRAVAIVLSGTGSDGSRSLSDIAKAGGLCMVQSPESSAFDGMPRAAIDTGFVDIIVDAEQMPGLLVEHATDSIKDRASDFNRKHGTDASGRFGEIFELLKEKYGIDFGFYKPTTVDRRIERRMSLLNIDSTPSYLDLLQSDDEELNALYRDLLIGVTQFMRDPEAFEQLAGSVVPEIIQRAATNDEIRVWVCGCATGEEAYSIAMLFTEALEQSQRQDLSLKLFATDVHRRSLDIASSGQYSEEALRNIGQRRRERFFIRDDNTYQVVSSLRQSIVFSEHNVLRDPPFTKIDLVCCRNLLIYFKSLAQKRAIAMFHFALKTDAVLFLGKSENLGTLESEFEAIHWTWKVFRKIRDRRLPPEYRLPMPGNAGAPNPGMLPIQRGNHDHRLFRAYDALLERYMPPGVLISETRELLHTFGNAGRYFRTMTGRMRNDALEFFEGDLRIAVTAALQKAVKDNDRVSYHGIRTDGSGQRINLQVQPVDLRSGRDSYYLITFEPIIDPQDSATALPTEKTRFDAGSVSKDRITLLEQELMYTREHLQSTVEELETSNEELQATNEELLAANEELQSTNEELHSVNEELYTVNAEYENKNRELEELATDMENLLRSTRIGTVFVDSQMRIRKFTPAIGKSFNMLPLDIGRPIQHISHKLQDSETLFDDIESVMHTGTTMEKEVRNADGEWLLKRITPYRLENRDIRGAVVTFVEIDRIKIAEEQLRRINENLERAAEAKAREIADNEQRLRLALQATAAGVFDFSLPGAEDLFFDERIAQILAGTPARMPDPGQRATWLMQHIHPDDLAAAKTLFQNLAGGQTNHGLLSVRVRCAENEWRWIEVAAGGIRVGDESQPRRIVGLVRDIHDEKLVELRYRESVRNLNLLYSNITDGLILADDSGMIREANQAFAGLIGQDRESVLGLNIVNLFDGEARDWLLDTDFADTVNTEHRLTTVLKSDAAQEIPVEINRYAIRDETGGPRLSGYLIRDLRETQRQSIQLERALLELQRSNSELENFAFAISHDLREPLRQVMGFSQLIQTRANTELEPKLREYLDYVVDGVQRMSTMLEGLLEFSRVQRQRHISESVNLAEIVATAISNLRTAREEAGAEIKVDSGNLPKQLEADPNQMLRLFQNLIGNAIKFRAPDVRPQISIGGEIRGDNCIIHITDNGIGIKPEYHSRIFGMFQRLHTSAEYDGSGIGLAICQRIVQTMGGEIGVDSEPGKGARFRINLPLRGQSQRRSL